MPIENAIIILESQRDRTMNEDIERSEKVGPRSKHLLRLLFAGFGLFALLATSTFAQGPAATSPTPSQDPAAIDQIWQRASANYDRHRSAILQEVDAATHKGRAQMAQFRRPRSRYCWMWEPG